LAPYHSRIEDSYLGRASLRILLPDIRGPVLVVGAGQGLIVQELRDRGLHCDGVDFSAEMIKYARARRGLRIVRADAEALPFRRGAYGTLIYASGVVDFIADVTRIRMIMADARRVAGESGKVFVAFYRFSDAQERFLSRLGLLRNGVLFVRSSLELHRLPPHRALRWVAQRADTGAWQAGVLLLRTLLFSSTQEKAMGVTMQGVFKRADDPESLIDSAPVTQPYRDEEQVRRLFGSLSVPVKRVLRSGACWVVQI